MNPKPELLAPAGNIESFFGAIQNGADAVYLGLKKFSARATAANFTIEDLATLMPFAHNRGVHIYIALNSQIVSSQIPEVLDTLHALASLKPDGLIVQDAGIFHLVRRWFPGLKLHASTLTAAHNTAGVKALQGMGANRVVLARELSLGEIEKICQATEAELEIFIHGALCYSYSGLCLASSFRGGRSGLRGECVQPCRLKFRQGNKEGFFLSCNDLCALPLIPRLKRLRIAAFKIEGRMKPAAWVADVVKAYRLVLDAESAVEEQQALIKAQELIAQAPSRRLSSGHLDQTGAGKILAPHRSGSSGAWSATVKSVLENRVLIDLRYPIAKGDRLRPESSAGREQEAFTVSQLFDGAGESILFAQAGAHVYLASPKPLHSGDRLFKVGTKSESAAAIWKKIREEVPRGVHQKSKFPRRQSILDDLEKPAEAQTKQKGTLIVKVDSGNDLVEALKSSAAMVLLSATKNNLERIAKQRFSPSQMKKLGFSLPPLIFERDIEYFRAAVMWFVKKGFLLWEINNWGHFDLTGQGRGVRLVAGSRLNLRNSAAFARAVELGCRWSVVSLEVTREELKELAQKKFSAGLVLTVYCRPPLFTSRLIPALHEDRPFLSPRKEVYHLIKKAGGVEIYADRPVSLFEHLPVLRSFGYGNFLVDFSEAHGKQPDSLEAILRGFAASRSPTNNYSLFNFERMP
ncbi:MAG: peptidase U32 family protein [Syntrophobacteraceae bacterium]